MVFGIAWWWVVLAAVVYYGIGALWYSPAMFFKPWQKEVKKLHPDRRRPDVAMFTGAVAVAVQVLVGAFLIQLADIHGFVAGAQLGLVVWLGFTAMPAFLNSEFQGGSLKLLSIEQGYHLVGSTVALAILAH